MRFALSFIVALGAAAACNKPESDDCRKALDNMAHIIGTENLKGNSDNEGEVRRCRGGSSKEAVACAIKATTKEELVKCDFMKVPHKPKADDDKKPDDKKE